MVFMVELKKMKMKSHHVYVFHHVSGTASIYTTTFSGEPFFLRNNPRILGLFDDFDFKTVE